MQFTSRSLLPNIALVLALLAGAILVPLPAAAGHILTTTAESLVYAYRGTNPAGLAFGFFDPAAAPVYTLPNLASRAAGSTDFFDIVAVAIRTAAPLRCRDGSCPYEFAPGVS